MGIGDWGFGTGGWGVWCGCGEVCGWGGGTVHPHTPPPQTTYPQSPIPNEYLLNYYI